MPVRPILIYPDPHLLIRTERWNFDSGDLSELMSLSVDLRDTLAMSSDGVALAANQIGIKYRIVSLTEKNRLCFNLQNLLINPVWEPVGEEQISDQEGCLSFPGISLKVKRFKKIELLYQNLDGFHFTTILEDFWARVIQHECDHLLGTTFLTYQRRMVQQEITKEFTRKFG